MKVFCIDNSLFYEQYDDIIEQVSNSLPQEGQTYTVEKQHIKDGECFYELKECRNLEIVEERDDRRVCVVFAANCFIPVN